MKGYKTVIFGLLLAIAPAGLTYLAGIDWTQYVGPNVAGLIAGAIVILLRAVTTTPIGKSDNAVKFTPTGRFFVIGFLCILGALAMASRARAADLKVPAKAPQFNIGSYATGGCGFYYGVNTMGGGGSIAGPIGATEIQGDIGATVGYGCPMGAEPSAFWFVEGNFDFANINGSSNGLSLTGPAHFEQRFGAGGPISAMLNSGLFPNLNPGKGLSVPTLPGLPAGLTYGPSYPFLFVSLHEEDVSVQAGAATARDWLFSPGIGVGLQSRLSNNVVAETAAQWVLRSNGIGVGPNKVGFGNGAEVSFTLKY